MKCNTDLSKLFTQYAVMIEMCDGTSIPPWECVKNENSGEGSKAFTTQPTFYLPYANYEFAIGIVEGKPVFNGDTIYNRKTKIPFTCTDGVAKRTEEGVFCIDTTYSRYYPANYTWKDLATAPEPPPLEAIVTVVSQAIELTNFIGKTGVFDILPPAMQKGLKELKDDLWTKFAELSKGEANLLATDILRSFKVKS